MPVQSELKACKTAASITEIVDGFEVLRTASVAETFRLYAAITKRLAVCQQHVSMLAYNAQIGCSSADRLQLRAYRALCSCVHSASSCGLRVVQLLVQVMYGPLTSTSPSVQQDGEQLPTFEQLAQRVQANMKITVRDVWGLMLTALPGDNYTCISHAGHMQILRLLRFLLAGWWLGRNRELRGWENEVAV